ncbi:hypothetical protein [Methylocapsa sp. S129]|uniref:hypothetical protein n=1 Tax=Methylocapsa sp. S129 TaxID=1641869 RepID=UPI00131B22A6|nr:hypothetical protein [Methylocapsa sp. S129]
MSLSETSPLERGRSFWKDGRRFAILLLALPAAGCFQPLYGEAAHPGLVAEMQAIKVEPLRQVDPVTLQTTTGALQQSIDLDRIDHYLENDLIANLNGTGTTPEPKYRLVVTPTFGAMTPTVSSQIGVANAATVLVTAAYTLTPIGGREAVLKGTASNAAVYDRTEDRFANLRAQRDTEIRLSKSLAEEIELRIAAYLGEKK